MDAQQQEKMRLGRAKMKRTGGPVSHTIRTADEKTIALKPYTRGKAIKCFCMECLGFEGHPKDCPAPLCPLYPYRGRTLATQRGEGN